MKRIGNSAYFFSKVRNFTYNKVILSGIHESDFIITNCQALTANQKPFKAISY
jgi:hypothetical protein